MNIWDIQSLRSAHCTFSPAWHSKASGQERLDYKPAAHSSVTLLLQDCTAKKLPQLQAPSDAFSTPSCIHLTLFRSCPTILPSTWQTCSPLLVRTSPSPILMLCWYFTLRETKPTQPLFSNAGSHQRFGLCNQTLKQFCLHLQLHELLIWRFFYKISGADLPQMILELWWLALWGEERRSISYAEIQQSDPSFSFTLSMQLSWAYTSVLLLFPFSCIIASTKLVRNRIARRQDSQDSMFFKI